MSWRCQLATALTRVGIVSESRLPSIDIARSASSAASAYRSCNPPGPTVSASFAGQLRLFLQAAKCNPQRALDFFVACLEQGVRRSRRDPPGSDSCCRSTSSGSRCSPGRCIPNAVPESQRRTLSETAAHRDPVLKFHALSGSMSRSSVSRSASSSSSEPISAAVALWSTTPRRGRSAAWPETTHRRVLHDGGAAPGADRRCPDHAVIEDTGHQHPDRARAEVECDGSEQGVDRRPVPVLRRAIRQGDAMVVHKKVAVGNSHVNRAGLQARHRGPPRSWAAVHCDR